MAFRTHWALLASYLILYITKIYWTLVSPARKIGRRHVLRHESGDEAQPFEKSTVSHKPTITYESTKQPYINYKTQHPSSAYTVLDYSHFHMVFQWCGVGWGGGAHRDLQVYICYS